MSNTKVYEAKRVIDSVIRYVVVQDGKTFPFAEKDSATSSALLSMALGVPMTEFGFLFGDPDCYSLLREITHEDRNATH